MHDISNKLPKNTYTIYKPYPDSEKNIIYKDQQPHIKLLEIECHSPLRHQDILGSLYGINLDPHTYGDILIIADHYYLYILDDIYSYILSHLLTISKYSITIKEIDIDYLEHYHLPFIECEAIVSSLRIDNVLGVITRQTRKTIENSITNQEVLLNYRVIKKHNIILKPGDILSIRKYGKYKYINVIATTKKDKYLISYYKYP